QTFNYPSYLDKHVEKVSRMSSHDTAISPDIPDMTRLLKRVMEKLNDHPVEVQIINPLTGEPMNVKVGSFGLALVLRLDIDDAADIPVIPRMLYELDHGDTAILKWFIQKRVVFAFAVTANGLTQGISSGVSPERWQQIEKEATESIFKNIVNFPFADVKDTWPVPSLQANLNKPMISDVRTLFLSGDLDCRTPVEQAEEIRKGFTTSAHIIVQNAGHEQVLTHPEIRKAITVFLSGKAVENVKPAYPPIAFISLTAEGTPHPALKR
ncbi:MAG TPA: alpha/beta hydrolase, partial [Ohtaekwangia sp.]